MFYHVVLFCLVLICKEPSGANEVKPSLAEQLNATLSFPGWMRMSNVRAKYRSGVNENISFTGNDVFVSDNVFFGNGNFFNTLVRDDNAAVKHYMVTHLMGCIYMNAMVKFTDLLILFFEEEYRTRKILKVRARQEKIKKLEDAKDAEYTKKAAEEAIPIQIETTFQQSHEESVEKSVNPGDRPADNEIIDYKVPWEILNFALLQFTDSSIMFDRMLSTMRYLIDRIPSCESFDPYTRELLNTKVIPCLQLFKDSSRNINLVLPGYIGKDDPDYNDKVGPFSSYFVWFLNEQANKAMRPFLDNFCTVSQTASTNLKLEISKFQQRYKRKPTVSLEIAHQLGEAIRQFVYWVCNSYYSQLGFLYDNRDQTTSYHNPPTL